jgi:ABC-type multidrug transport system ATPase subunit
MKLEISIRDVQHIKSVNFSVNLAAKSLVCITGKNGSGKTTLIKSIRNLINADTFQKTSSTRSFTTNSEITYKVDDANIVFKYNSTKKTIDTRDSIPQELRNKVFVELPIPYGERFNFFQKVSDIDDELRSNIVLRKFIQPTELIYFLESIYGTKKFVDLVEVGIRKTPYYAIILDADYHYLREDYFSSGEYFLISLYRRIKSGYTAIFIDEIDISLDAAAQVRLVEWLKIFKEKYNTTFVFTTHSLAMMRTLEPDELFCMEGQDDGSTAIKNRSYAFIKSTLFGFSGWDKYILTEDDVLKDFLQHLIQKHCRPSFYQHKIIYVGGGRNTTDLMERNSTENFLSKNTDSVITILDGDQKGKPHSNAANVFCIPMASVEKELLVRCLRGEFWDFDKLKMVINDRERLIDFINNQVAPKPSKAKAILLKIKKTYFGIVLLIKKSPGIRREISVANGEPAKDKDFKNAGKRLFKYLTASKIFTRQDIFDFLIKKNQKEIEILCRQIENFLRLDSQ